MIIYEQSQSSIPDGYTNCQLSYATLDDYKNAYPNRINNICVTGEAICPVSGTFNIFTTSNGESSFYVCGAPDSRPMNFSASYGEFLFFTIGYSCSSCSWWDGCARNTLYPFKTFIEKGQNYNIFMCICANNSTSCHFNTWLCVCGDLASYNYKSAGTCNCFSVNFCKVCSTLYKVYINGSEVASATSKDNIYIYRSVYADGGSSISGTGFPMCICLVSGKVYYRCC